MSTEARIGIVAGLVIVVVASVYFFYGSGKKEADVLISAGPQFFTPPKIPADAAKKATPSAAKAPATPAGRSAQAPPGAAGTPGTPGAPNQPRPIAPLPGGVPRTGGAAGLPPGPDRVAAASPGSAGAPGRVMPPAPTGAAGPGATARPPLVGSAGSTGSTAGSPAPMGPPEPKARGDSSDDSTFYPPVPLRTGPSPALVEATRENLRKAADGNNERPLDAGVTPSGARAPSGASPTGAVAAKAAPPSETWPRKHRIAEGDTLSALADNYYGSSKSLPLILKANPQIKDPRALKIGDEITIPEPPKPAAADSSTGSAAAKPAEIAPATGGSVAADPRVGRTYAVREGDSFYSIAAAELRDATRWTEIYKLNRELVKDDPKRLRPGMVITLP